MRRRILFYVQHLLGIGHLMRASRIARALSERFDVSLVVGGDLPPGLVHPGIALFRLPPVKAGAGGFSTLVHCDGSPFGDSDKAERRDLLLAHFESFRPDVLLFEAFPFGRRQMRFELLPLLERATAAPWSPLIACSVRDILQETPPHRRAETADLIRRYFGLVLVHGDPGFVSLSDSFPEAGAFADLIATTGMVGPGAEAVAVPLPPDDVFDVVVSVGGGAMGARLVEAAVAARPMSRLAGARWLVLTGPNAVPSPALGSTDPAVSVRCFVSDLPARLARARISVSQAGYNTAADLVATRCRAVLVPYAEGGETEQTRRATLFAERGLAVMLGEERLSPASLAEAIDHALGLPAPKAALSLDGAAETSRAIERRLARMAV